jgi:hypothetical protein
VLILVETIYFTPSSVQIAHSTGHQKKRKICRLDVLLAILTYSNDARHLDHYEVTILDAAKLVRAVLGLMNQKPSAFYKVEHLEYAAKALVKGLAQVQTRR